MVRTNHLRPCTVSESIARSCQEVKKMRSGQVPKRSLNSLFARIDAWTQEEKMDVHSNSDKAV